jgi:hypothetical protein
MTVVITKRHRAVDLVGEVDEPRLEAVDPRLPGQVQGVDRDAVPTQPGPRVERHEAERLAAGGVDDLPHVEPERPAHQRQLVDEADVDRPEGVLQQLDHLRRLGARHHHDLRRDAPVELGRTRRAGRRDAAEDARDAGDGEALVAGVDPLGREAQVEVLADPEPGRLQRRQHHLRGRAGVRGALEDHELAAAKPSPDAVHGLDGPAPSSCRAASARR